MINRIDERYARNTKNLLQSYDIALFEKSQDREVLQALAMILGHVTQIEGDEAMVRMTYNMVEGLVCQEFATFLSNEIIKNLFNIKKGDFRHSSHLWWLIVHKNLQSMVEGGLSIVPITSSIASTTIDMRVPMLTKVHGSYYEFMEKCFSLVMKILIGRATHRLHESVREELQGENKI